MVDRSFEACKKVGGGRHQNIQRFFGNEAEWKKMLKTTTPDVVFIATNWKNHAPMAVEAMNQGAPAFSAVFICFCIIWGVF